MYIQLYMIKTTQTEELEDNYCDNPSCLEHDCDGEHDERSCVKCGKTSDLIEDEDMCYTCAKERRRI